MIWLVFICIFTAASFFLFYPLHHKITKYGLSLTTILLCVIVLALLTFSLYGWLGRPDLKDRPYAGRVQERAIAQKNAEKVAALLAQFNNKVKNEPTNSKNWYILAQLNEMIGNSNEAARAYQRYIQLEPKDITAKANYIRLLLKAYPQNQPLPPEVLGLLHDILALDPNNLNALYLMGLNEEILHHVDLATLYYTRLLKQIPTDNPNYVTLQSHIKSLQSFHGK